MKDQKTFQPFKFQIEVTSSRLSELEAELSSSLEKIKVLHSAEENHETQISELTSKLSKAQETIRYFLKLYFSC